VRCDILLTRCRSPGLNDVVTHRLHQASLVDYFSTYTSPLRGKKPWLLAALSPGHCPLRSPATGALKGCGPLSVVSTYWSAASNPSGGNPVLGRLTGTTGVLGGGSTARLSSLESFALNA
jgi:hypothetical protein